MAIRIWATDENFPAGSEEWSGTPTKVQPSPGEIAAGVAPEEQIPAQWINWLFNLATFASLSRPRAAYTWSDQVTGEFDRDIANFHAGRVCSVLDGTTGLPYLVCLLDNGVVVRSRMGGDISWEPANNTGGAVTNPTSGMFCFASKYKLYVVTPADGKVYATTNIAGFNTFSEIADLGSLAGLNCGGWYGETGRAFLGGDSDIFYSDDQGVGWLTATTPNNLDVIQIVTPERGETSDYLLAIATGVGGSVPLYSTDNGETWLESGSMASHPGVVAAGCYRAIDKTYWIVTSDVFAAGNGRVYYTSNPAVPWTYVMSVGEAARKIACLEDTVIVTPESKPSGIVYGNAWAFTAGEAPTVFAIGDHAYDWSTVIRHNGSLVAVRAREVDTGDWRLEHCSTPISPQALRESYEL